MALDNDEFIFLHDTNREKALFNRAQRCLEPRLGARGAGAPTKLPLVTWWFPGTRSRCNDLAGEDLILSPLPEIIPVSLVYPRNSFPMSAGKLVSHPDIYGNNRSGGGGCRSQGRGRARYPR